MLQHDDRYSLATRERAAERNFIAPGPAPLKPVRVEVLPPEPVQQRAPAATTSAEVAGSYVDRAKSFQISTVPVAAAFGLGGVLVALLGAKVPLFSVAMLGVFWAGFLLWWLLGWAIHHLFSADGVALIDTLKGWHYLEREQAARLKRYEQESER